MARASKLTPLQSLVGVVAAEKDYDLLDIHEQLILDLLLDDWSQADIAFVLGISQSWVSIKFRQIRFKMAGSTLKRTLEIRQHYKDISPLRLESESELEEVL
jgi:hypothetical protein